MGINKIGDGQAWKFGDDISTDLIAPGQYFHLRSNLSELAKHVLEGAEVEHTDSKFAELFSQGDFVVAGRNFGMGSSREHAAAIIKISGVSAVLAKSFARIFFRNAINVGLPVIQCDTGRIEPLDILQLNLKEGFVEDKTRNFKLPFAPLPGIMLRILNSGGLRKYVKEHNGLVLPRD